jgi:hypothetical protein
VWGKDPRFCCLYEILKDATKSRNTRSDIGKLLVGENLAFKPLGKLTVHAPYGNRYFCKKEHFKLCVALIALNGGKQHMRQKLVNMIAISSNLDIDMESFQLAVGRVAGES